MALTTRTMKTVQRVPVPQPQARITTTTTTTTPANDVQDDSQEPGLPHSLIKLHQFAECVGDISHLMDPSVVDQLGHDAVTQWNIDNGSRADWVAMTERGLSLAAQEDSEDDEEKDFPFDNASDINYPIITTATQQFAARAYPELVKGDKAVGVKVFDYPQSPNQPQPAPQAQQAPAGVPPTAGGAGGGVAPPPAAPAPNPADIQAQAMQEREARARRVQAYLNWLIFYKMDDWEGETDALIHEMPISGAGFKKVYMGTTGLCSDYVSALRLTVHQDTKSIDRCPRITQDFDAYPYEISQKQRAGIYRDVHLPVVGEDPETPRLFIEQHRLEDLDNDGLAEPYIVTVDVETKQTLRVECAYAADDIFIHNPTGKVIRIERWQPFPSFKFLPDPRGRFYGIGFARLLDSISDSVDTSINQLMDAGTAEIAGGGFIGSNVRLQGSGQGGTVWFRPGEYQTVSTAGPDLKSAIWERTTPHPSEVTFKLLDLLLTAAKDIASVKDVITGDSPATAPVGTTMAVQSQALQVFSSIYKRIYRGFRDEFQLMFKCLSKWGGEREAKEYLELTGGDFKADFSGDGTDIKPISDPSVVTKMQKIARLQSLTQFAESEVGKAAGMTMPGPAQEIAKEALDIMEFDRPERFFAVVPPNPEIVAKVAELNAKADDNKAAAALKTADLKFRSSEDANLSARTNLDNAKTIQVLGEAAKDTHAIHQEAAKIGISGMTNASPEGALSDSPEPTPAIDPNALLQQQHDAAQAELDRQSQPAEAGA